MVSFLFYVSSIFEFRFYEARVRGRIVGGVWFLAVIGLGEVIRRRWGGIFGVREYTC